MPYARYLGEKLLHPAGLGNTGYDSHSQIILRCASGYILRGNTLQNAEFLDMSVPYSAGGLRYGYGLFLSTVSGHTCFFHSGGVNGFIAMLQYFPELDGSLVVLSNLYDPPGVQAVLQHASQLISR